MNAIVNMAMYQTGAGEPGVDCGKTDPSTGGIITPGGNGATNGNGGAGASLGLSGPRRASASLGRVNGGMNTAGEELTVQNVTRRLNRYHSWTLWSVILLNQVKSKSLCH